MHTSLKPVIWILFFGLISCKKEENIKFHLSSIDSNTYYSEEIIPDDYRMIYGKWKLNKISGGFSGMGHNPDYDYLEIKNIGIYGLVRGGNLFEYGKIELVNFDSNNKDLLQVKFTPEFSVSGIPHIAPPEKYIHLNGKDSLDLIAPCCDMYNYHYTRVK